MNIQAIMKQAQSMQKEMVKIQEEINQTEFCGENGFVKVKINGKKELVEVKISNDHIEKEDIELLEDMILLATNSAIKKVEDFTEQKMGKFSNLMPGMF